MNFAILVVVIVPHTLFMVWIRFQPPLSRLAAGTVNYSWFNHAVSAAGLVLLIVAGVWIYIRSRHRFVAVTPAGVAYRLKKTVVTVPWTEVQGARAGVLDTILLCRKSKPLKLGRLESTDDVRHCVLAIWAGRRRFERGEWGTDSPSAAETGAGAKPQQAGP